MIQIQVLSVQTETKQGPKSSYQMLEVAYKDMTQGGKVGSKKLMSFSRTEATTFKTMAIAKPLEIYDVDLVKGEQYWEWTKAVRNHNPSSSTGDASSAVNSTPRNGGNAGSVTRSTYETPEERAKKQIYIVRQSSLSSAVAILSVGAKHALDTKEVINVARQLEEFVFGSDTAAVVNQDVGSIDPMDDAIPF